MRASEPQTGAASSMSSATPAAFWSAMSMMTTSASCLSATPRATVAPTLPAPPTTVTLRFIVAPAAKNAKKGRDRKAGVLRGLCGRDSALRSLRLHVRDNVVAELGRLQLGGALGQPREVVGDPPRGDRAFHPLDDQIGRLVPSHVAEHHLAGQDHR